MTRFFGQLYELDERLFLVYQGLVYDVTDRDDAFPDDVQTLAEGFGPDEDLIPCSVSKPLATQGLLVADCTDGAVRLLQPPSELAIRYLTDYPIEQPDGTVEVGLIADRSDRRGTTPEGSS